MEGVEKRSSDRTQNLGTLKKQAFSSLLQGLQQASEELLDRSGTLCPDLLLLHVFNTRGGGFFTPLYMSHHQSRADRSDSQQRRGARSGGGAAHQRTSAGKGGGGGGQGPSASALLSPASQPAPVASSKRSGGVNGQARGHVPANFDSSEGLRTQQNTPAHQQTPQVSSVQPGIKSSNGAVPRLSRPATPSSSSVATEAATVVSKSETPWNSTQPQLSFQFGSIGPSIGTLVQIPARTSSAPPNLDEQKQDLLRFEAVNVQPVKVPIPTGGQQQGPRSQVQQSGGQQQQPSSFRPQPQQSATTISAGIPQPPYHQQGQQHPIPVQVTQSNSHLQATSVVTTQAHLPMQAHLISSQPQQQGLVQIPYSQHSLQPQLQHNGGQVLKYPQSMAGPPLMGPPLAPLPGPMPATQLSQMSHQLPGGLGPGMPGAPYGVPVQAPFIPLRTSSAVKIVHPETHEELKFDYKSSKPDNFYEGVVPAAPQSRMIANGPSHTRPPLSYASGGHHSVNQNVYAAQQNGPYNPPMQHYYQPSPPSAVVSKNAMGSEGALPSKMQPVSNINTASSREVTAEASTPSFSVASNTVPPRATSEKQGLSPAIPSLGTVDQVQESKADVEEKPVKVQSIEGASVTVKDPAMSVKEAKEESSCLTSLNDCHKTDSTTIIASESRQNSKKKKKKEGPSRANSGDASKVSRALEAKKQGESKTLEPQKAKSEIHKLVDQVDTSLACTSVAADTMPEAIDVTTSAETMSKAVDVTTSAGQAHNCNGELAIDNPSIVTDISVNYEIQCDSAKELGPLAKAVPESALDIEPSVNRVHKALAADLAIGSDEHTERQSDELSVQVDCQRQSDEHTESQSDEHTERQSDELSVQVDCQNLVNSSMVASIDLSSQLSHAVDTAESAIVMEAQANSVEALVDENQEICEVKEADTCTSKEVEVCQDSAVIPEVNYVEESFSSGERCKEEGGLESQIEAVELHSNRSSSPKAEASEDTGVTAAPDVKQGSKKKKLKDILAKADAAGRTADLYNAYKAPEEKKLDEVVPPKDSKDDGSMLPVTFPAKQAGKPDENAAPREIDDWEDAVELPSPKVSSTDVGDGKMGEKHASEAKVGETYTRDFLLTFKEQNVDIPPDFEVRPDIAELLSNPQAAFARLADSGRMLDRQLSGGPRRSNSSTSFDDDRWARQSPGLHSPLWPDTDMGPAGGFRPGNAQGLIPRMPPNIRPGITVPPLVPGLISGKPLTPGAGPGLFRTNTVDSDRWQRMPTGQKGLIPSPLTPLPPVHKAEKRYEVGKASDDEEHKQRQIKGILNKLTPQNFQKLFDQVKDVNIQSAVTLTGVISQIFDKALTEPTFCEMYATFCKQLATDMPEFIEDGNKVTFKRVLLNKCQDEFHRGEREQAEASAVEEEGKESMTPEEREEKRIMAKRRMLGNIRFIGELYKKHMLTERIMHECIRTLLGDYENPEEEDVEALCKLMSTIGYMIDQPMTREHIDAYLKRITRLSNNQKLSARIRFMLKDLIDLRRNGWQERRKVEGPKRIEEVHRDAVQERQATVAQAGRLSRGPSIGVSSGRRLVPPELSTRGPPSPMFSPTTPVATVRGVQPQGGIRGSYVQDVRMEDKLLMERSTPMPLSQRSADEGPLTLGPQGGLGRGMSLRTQPSGSGFATAGEIRRFGPGSMAAYSGSGPLGAERPVTPPERPLLDRPATATADRFASGNSTKSIRQLERTLSDKAPAALNSHHQQQGLSSRPSTAPAYVPLTEEELRKKSETALLEYFSAHDLKEAAQCVEDLRAPKFHPTMVFSWIVLAFEKKDPDRELLAKLLISLQRLETPLLKQEQISHGFQLVLEILEDCIIDTPMAPDYLVQLLVQLISAGTLTLDQVGDLMKEKDVLQSGFGLDIFGKILAGLREDRGERSLLDMFRCSGLQLEDFLISGKPGSKSLHEFLQEYSLQCLGPESDPGSSINNLQPVGVQLLEHLSKNEPISETLRWLEKIVTPQMQSDSSFLQMLMMQVLKHSLPAGSYEKDQRNEIIRERISHYRTLLKRFATDKEKQRQYIVAMQLYAHDIGHPAGLMTNLFTSFYEEEVISEAAFYKWQDDVNGPTLGRDKALRDVYRWLQWLRTAPEQSQDDEF
ncbi:hypothetical protein GOP47_0017932 [Adiantum capillus-veneris]|uniref:Eukaryotic translation initiation factor 4 gamma 2 n=1 Tax=Adiantum capillus-veneris TaxID=13818 RepID=A0A9D4ZA57_ADICA|nr:hypothetical protein GOP47_0017932 [Adiantum capillus-veneris]